MKNFNIKAAIGAVLISTFLLSCSDILDEQPRSKYEPSYFRTNAGVQAGLISLYENLRDIYGQAYYYNTLETGTDEYTYAESADDNFKVMDMTGLVELNGDESRSDVLWGACLKNINTANGIIENAEAAGSLSEALISEARFFRAFDYFQLVQTFGGVPLDLGSGELKFNSNPVSVTTRNTVPEVYTRAIFPGLKTAIENLPAVGRVKGGVTQTLARLILSKAYLTYAWWLENPNNIATYPETDRVDPDGHNAAWYYQQAYDVALEGINNPGEFRLMDTYYDVHLGSNDRNAEIMFYADRDESSEEYNGSSLTYSGAGTGDNCAVWMVTWNYTNIRSTTTPGGDYTFSSVQREAVQEYGRPWTRMAPTIGAIKNTFSDKTNDSRYDGTFVTTYTSNWQKNPDSKDVEEVYNANDLSVGMNQPILTFLPEDIDGITYPNTNAEDISGCGAGIIAGRSDYVIAPSAISRLRYPGLWKLGTYRTDNGDGLGSPNGASTRPFNIAKFSELYFIAAEAAVKGASTANGMTARQLINEIRGRAGKWRYDNHNRTEKIQDNSQAMKDATPETITIDYILEERSREYFGEGYRWFDLIRTQKWEQVASTYQICGRGRGDHEIETFNRTIEKYYYLRPIPQGELDKMEMTQAEKDALQNPGY